MTRYPECPQGCGGEDCVCCEIFVERQADLNREPEPVYDDGPFGYDYY